MIYDIPTNVKAKKIKSNNIQISNIIGLLLIILPFVLQTEYFIKSESVKQPIMDFVEENFMGFDLHKKNKNFRSLLKKEEISFSGEYNYAYLVPKDKKSLKIFNEIFNYKKSSHLLIRENSKEINKDITVFYQLPSDFSYQYNSHSISPKVMAIVRSQGESKKNVMENLGKLNKNKNTVENRMGGKIERENKMSLFQFIEKLLWILFVFILISSSSLFLHLWHNSLKELKLIKPQVYFFLIFILIITIFQSFMPEIESRTWVSLVSIEVGIGLNIYNLFLKDLVNSKTYKIND